VKYRKLRIAWSVLWGVVAVLLVVLWARSYWWSDVITLTTPPFDAGIDSASGGTTISFFVDADRELTTEWIRKSYRHTPSMRPPNASWKFEIYVTGNGLDVSLPHWLYVMITSVIAAASWIQRFRLRALLIATTLVAMLLGPTCTRQNNF
jgi:hypothetical protein